MELTPELQEKKIFLIEGLKKTYKEQYDAIQPLPYIKDKLYCVDKVFVEGGVEICLAQQLTRGTGGLWERLESYKSVYTDLRFKSKRRIIQGEPGYGKSTLTLQLAYDWCNDVSDSPMNNVEILILLRLRQLGSIKCLFRAIKMFLLSREPRVSKHDIEKIIHSCSSVHIILDGYDEYPGRDDNDNDDVHRIINMEMLADFDVSLTTRYLPGCLRKETKRAKLTGFDDKARDEYIRKAVVGNNDEAVEEIKQQLYKNSILVDLCQVPLIFVTFAHMALDDERDFMKFKSVTQFFKHMIRYFSDHLKQKFKDNRGNMFYLHEMKHHELDKIAFEGLNNKNQQLSWIKTKFLQRVGPESYHQYISIGILVEEDVVSNHSTGDNVLFTREVRFYHKLFCEWYAAHHLVTFVKKGRNLKVKLRFLDPFDLQYLFRFACGLDPNAGKKLINHLKRLPGGDTFAVLCILEQTGDVNDIIYAVEELCSRDVEIQGGDSALLQRSTTQLLDIASKNDIPVSCLHLDYSSIKFEGDTIVLSSGIPLPILPTVENFHLDGSSAEYDNTESLPSSSRSRQQTDIKRTLTAMDVLNLFHYGMKCGRVKELMFDQLLLPTFFSPETFTETMKTRNIQVRWRPFDHDFHLDQQNGHWEVDDIQEILNDTSGIVCLGERNILQDTSNLQLLEVARNHDITISCVWYSFSKIDAGDVILHSGLRLSCPASVKKVVIETETEREMTKTEVVDILMFVQQSHMLKELEFENCLLPLTFSSESIPAEMQSRDIKVLWTSYGYSLNLQSGAWKVDIVDTVRKLCTRLLRICPDDSELLQRCTIKLLENASYYDIPISVLRLDHSFSKIDAGDVILHSGLRLPCPTTVEEVAIKTENGREMTETEVVDILMFVQKSHKLKELWFDDCLLPAISSSEAILAAFKTRDIKVLWRSCGYSLNLQSGAWEVDIDSVKRMCTQSVSISSIDSDSIQRCTIQLLEYASAHDIPISCLCLDKSISKIDGGDIILHSGLRLSCPVSVKEVVVYAEIETLHEGRKMTETEVVDILMFVQKSHMLKALRFEWCLLPQSIPAESIPSILKSRNVKVTGWFVNEDYKLNLQSGRWVHIGTRKEITDSEYNHKVTRFRNVYRHTYRQRATISSERESEIPTES